MSQKDVLRTVDTVTDPIVNNETVRNRKGILVTPAVAKRQNIEYAIVRRVVIDAIKAGYSIDVDNGGDEPDLVGSTNVKHVLAAMMETDDERLYLRRGDYRLCSKHYDSLGWDACSEFFEGDCEVEKARKDSGWVYFVYGNAGWDVVNDYTNNLDSVMAGAMALAARYEERAR